MQKKLSHVILKNKKFFFESCKRKEAKKMLKNSQTMIYLMANYGA